MCLEIASKIICSIISREWVGATVQFSPNLPSCPFQEAFFLSLSSFTVYHGLWKAMNLGLIIFLDSSLSILSKPMAFLISSVLKHSIYQRAFATGSTSLSHTQSVSMETSRCLRKYLATKDWYRYLVFRVLFHPLNSEAGHNFADLHFASDVPLEAIFAFYTSHQLQIQLSISFSLHTWALPLHSSWVAWPHFHLCYTSSLYWGSVWHPPLNQAGSKSYLL